MLQTPCQADSSSLSISLPLVYSLCGSLILFLQSPYSFPSNSRSLAPAIHLCLTQSCYVLTYVCVCVGASSWEWVERKILPTEVWRSFWRGGREGTARETMQILRRRAGMGNALLLSGRARSLSPIYKQNFFLPHRFPNCALILAFSGRRVLELVFSFPLRAFCFRSLQYFALEDNLRQGHSLFAVWAAFSGAAGSFIARPSEGLCEVYEGRGLSDLRLLSGGFQSGHERKEDGMDGSCSSAICRWKKTKGKVILLHLHMYIAFSPPIPFSYIFPFYFSCHNHYLPSMFGIVICYCRNAQQRPARTLLLRRESETATEIVFSSLPQAMHWGLHVSRTPTESAFCKPRRQTKRSGIWLWKR